MVWNKVPYTNFHDLNQDWIIRRMQEFIEEMDNIVALSVVKYADPIQWNITHQYEQSTIVIDAETGTAYISVKPVPAGVAITNTSYWTPVFDLSELFSDLEQQIANETAARTAAINALETSTNARFDEVEAQIESLADRYYIFIGDSFGEGWTPDGFTTPYPVLFKNHYSIQNDHFFNSNVGGAGFTTGTTFLMQLTALYSSIPDRSKITDIYVLGGRNEFSVADNAIQSAKQTFISYAKVNYPNAKIHIGFIGRSFEYISDTTMAKQFTAFRSYRSNTELYGADYLNGIELALNSSSFYASDGKHPNQAGQNAIMEALIAINETGTYKPVRVLYPQMQPGGSSTDTQPITAITMTENGDTITVIILPFYSNLDGAQKTLNRASFKIGTFNGMLCPGASYETHMCSVNCVVKVSGAYYNGVADISIVQNDLYVWITVLNDAHNNYLSGTVEQFQIGGMNFKYSGVSGE